MMIALSPTDITASRKAESPRPRLEQLMGIRTVLIFLTNHGSRALLHRLSYLPGYRGLGDKVISSLPFPRLGVALLIAGVWPVSFNFLRVIKGAAAAAFETVSLLPVELILRAGADAGLAMGC